MHWELNSLSPELLQSIENKVSICKYPRGTKIYTKFSLPTAAYIILNGTVQYVVENRRQTQVVQERRVGNSLGFTTLLCGTGISSNAAIVASETAILLQIPQEIFETLIISSRDTVETMVRKRAQEAVLRLQKFELSYRYLHIPKGKVRQKQLFD